MSENLSGKWKRDTALCFVTLIFMFLLVGLIFGLVFGTVFDCVTYLTIRSMAIMFVIALFTILMCYLVVPNTPKASKKWFELSREDYPTIYERTEEMCGKLGIPTPRLYVTGDVIPNAYALGRSPEQAHICVTYSLTQILTDDEFFAVIAHELSHIAHRDTLVMSIARNCTKALTMSSVIVGLMAVMFLGSVNQSSGKRSGSDFGPAAIILVGVALVFLVFAAILVITLPGATIISHFAVSRNREYLADEGSARITGKPMALASALRKLEDGCLDGSAKYPTHDAMKWTVNPNCLKKRGLVNRLFSTHPSTEERIRRLEKIAGESETVFADPRCRMHRQGIPRLSPPSLLTRITDGLPKGVDPDEYL